MTATPIPGNTYREFPRIYTDTTLEALQAHLTKIVRNQNPTLRSNVRYQNEVRRLSREIAARQATQGM